MLGRRFFWFDWYVEGASKPEEITVQGKIIGDKSGEKKPILHHPDVRRMLMDMKSRTEAGRAIAYYVAGCFSYAVPFCPLYHICDSLFHHFGNLLICIRKMVFTNHRSNSQ